MRCNRLAVITEAIPSPLAVVVHPASALGTARERFSERRKLWRYTRKVKIALRLLNISLSS